MQSKSSTAKAYPKDLTSAQFERIRPLLEASRERTKPLGTSLLEIFNAVLYVLREGCRWRSLPHDYPKWQTVYYHYRPWTRHVDSESGLPPPGAGP